jgi:hypothetical protein
LVPKPVCSIKRDRIPDDELNVVHPLGSRNKEEREKGSASQQPLGGNDNAL